MIRRQIEGRFEDVTIWKTWEKKTVGATISETTWTVQY